MVLTKTAVVGGAKIAKTAAPKVASAASKGANAARKGATNVKKRFRLRGSNNKPTDVAETLAKTATDATTQGGGGMAGKIFRGAGTLVSTGANVVGAGANVVGNAAKVASAGVQTALSIGKTVLKVGALGVGAVVAGVKGIGFIRDRRRARKEAEEEKKEREKERKEEKEGMKQGTVPNFGYPPHYPPYPGYFPSPPSQSPYPQQSPNQMAQQVAQPANFNPTSNPAFQQQPTQPMQTAPPVAGANLPTEQVLSRGTVFDKRDVNQIRQDKGYVEGDIPQQPIKTVTVTGDNTEKQANKTIFVPESVQRKSKKSNSLVSSVEQPVPVREEKVVKTETSSVSPTMEQKKSIVETPQSPTTENIAQSSESKLGSKTFKRAPNMTLKKDNTNISNKKVKESLTYDEAKLEEAAEKYKHEQNMKIFEKHLQILEKRKEEELERLSVSFEKAEALHATQGWLQRQATKGKMDYFSNQYEKCKTNFEKDVQKLKAKYGVT